MTKKIFKYPLEIEKEQTIEIPANARILTVKTQGNQIYLWAMVNPDHIPEKRKIRIYGTGHPVDIENIIYIGTVMTESENFVWHVFEAISIGEYFAHLSGLGMY